jgi:hypothetical protein
MKRISKISILPVLLALVSCSNEVDYGEQYKKTIYLVNSNTTLYTYDYFFGAENNEMLFSVYCASSEPITENVSILLKVDPDVLDEYNRVRKLSDEAYIDKVMLPADRYRLDGLEVIIEAGHQYGVLRVPFNPVGLDVNTAWTLPVSIVSNSAGYDMNPDLQSIIYEIYMVNPYSGVFSGSSTEVVPGATDTIRSVQVTLKAMSANTVRMPIHNMADDSRLPDTNFMLLTIAGDGSVSIAPYGSTPPPVTDLGGSFYDSLRQSYELNYRYGTLTIREKITNIKAPPVDELTGY